MLRINSILLLLALISIQTSPPAFCHDKLDLAIKTFRHDEWLVKSTKQLERKKFLTSFCSDEEQTRDVLAGLRNHSIEYEAIRRRSALKTNSIFIQRTFEPELKLECNGKLERIALVGLQDLTISSEVPTSSEKLVADELFVRKSCKRRIESFRRASASNSSTMQPIDGGNDRTIQDVRDHVRLLEQTCEKLTLVQQELLYDLVEQCNGRSSCSLSPASLRKVSADDCDSLATWNLKMVSQISYICLPYEATFQTRQILYQDLSKRISCPPSESLYIARASLHLTRLSSSYQSHRHQKSHCRHGDCKPSSMAGDFSYQKSSTVGADYTTYDDNLIGPLDPVDEALEKFFPSSGDNSDEELFEDELQRAPSSVDWNIDEQSARTKRAEENLVLCLLPQTIIENCHAQTSCLISLNKLIANLTRRSSCNLRKYNLSRSYAELDYLCLSNSKLIDSDRLQILTKVSDELVDFGDDSPTQHQQEQSRPMRVKLEVYNDQDYHNQATFTNEFASVVLENDGISPKRSLTCCLRPSLVLVSIVLLLWTFVVRIIDSLTSR